MTKRFFGIAHDLTETNQSKVDICPVFFGKGLLEFDFSLVGI